MSASRPSEKEIVEKIDNAIKDLDKQRSETLKRLQEIQAIKQRTLERERKRLKAK